MINKLRMGHFLTNEYLSESRSTKSRNMAPSGKAYFSSDELKNLKGDLSESGEQINLVSNLSRECERRIDERRLYM